MAQTTFTGPVVSQGGFIDSSFTTAERDAIVDPTAGLLIYNTTVNEYQVYTGTAWDTAFGGGSEPISFPLAYVYKDNSPISIPNDTPFVFLPSGLGFVQTNGTSIVVTNLSTPWDVTTVTNSVSYDVSGYLPGGSGQPDSLAPGGAFNATGTTYNTVGVRFGFEYYSMTFFLGTPYDFSTIFGAGANSSTLPTGMRGLTFSADGMKAYTLFGGNIYQITLGAPYAWNSVNSSNIVYTTIPVLSNFGLFNVPFELALNSTGTVGMLFQSGASYTGQITQFQIGTPYDLTTINYGTYQTQNLSAGIGYVSQGGIQFSSANDYIYVTASTSGFVPYIYQFDVVPLAAPNITGVSPSSGAIGSSVTITGTGFAGTTLVSFGGVSVTPVSVSSTQIVVNGPASTYNVPVDVTVINPVGSSTEVAAYTNITQIETFTDGADGSFGFIQFFFSNSLTITGASTALSAAAADNAAVGKSSKIFMPGTTVPPSWDSTVIASSSTGPGGTVTFTFANTSPFNGTPATLQLIG